MSTFGETLRRLLFGREPKATTVKRGSASTSHQGAQTRSATSLIPAESRGPKARVLEHQPTRPPFPYWQLRGWRRIADKLYLGYFKTPLGRCHGVIKWVSKYDFSFYVHNVPRPILNGPHGQCFSEVKPGKYKVHFRQLPSDLNSGIFYLETLLMEGFGHEHTK